MLNHVLDETNQQYTRTVFKTFKFPAHEPLNYHDETML